MCNLVQPNVGILILNWNGWEDSIECLESLREDDYENKYIIVVDNGSDNDSVTHLQSYLKKEYNSFAVIDYDINKEYKYLVGDSCDRVILLKNNVNFGFAKGNNIGIKLALYLGVKYVALLNNDTIVTKGYLSSLVNFLEEHRDFIAASSLINYYYEPRIVWYGGAKIFSYMYLRKYFYTDKNVEKIPNKPYIETSLVTGCSLLFDPMRAGFLSEDFFYGEEDYEFSLRARKRNYKLACVFTSIIYHKVGRSIKPRENQLNKICLYYTNRFVHLKRYFKYRFLWKLAIIPQMLYMMCLLYFIRKIDIRLIILLRKEIQKRVESLDAVNYCTFVDIMKLIFK